MDEEILRDALRYRWLRDNFVPTPYGEWTKPEELDSAVDAERLKPAEAFR